jgi:YD repeat-containing protein
LSMVFAEFICVLVCRPKARAHRRLRQADSPRPYLKTWDRRTTMRYLYDALGRRVSAYAPTKGKTNFTYDGDYSAFVTFRSVTIASVLWAKRMP